MKPISRTALAAWLLAALSPWICDAAAASYPKNYDIVVYGGNSGGVTAAVQAARMGKKVALISPISHLGGLTSSGLGWTDVGSTSILCGLSKDFYHRVYLHYAAQSNWNSIKSMAGQGTVAFDQVNQLGYIFEPKIAERIFGQMIAETNVEVFTGLLDLNGGVVMDGLRISALKLEDGRTFYGKMFIDAGYEGDVMAGAGVSFFVGREANSVYGETISGVQNGSGNEIQSGVSPYVVKGNAASGLLPGINATVAPNGTGDGHIQAYCYRMCLTSNAANRVNVAKPANYKDADFELVLRAVEAGQRTFFKLDAMPNGKTDSNNSGGISTDYIGRNWGDGWDWTTLNHQQRAALAAEHAYWQLGMIWTLQHHARVIAKVGASGLYSGWGLPADEFTDTGNFPPQLYVREGRRMVSDYVMTTKNCTGETKAMDSVGMGAYTMDSHNSQLFNASGQVKNEGGVGQHISAPYPISYRSVVPKAGQCENLLVPWSLSASHMAFGSIRMETVFMILGQSSATAAAMAINDNLSVQQLSYARLAAKLRADGLVLGAVADDVSPNAIVVDDADPGAMKVGDWTASTSTAGFNGAGYVHNGNTVDPKSVTYTPLIPTAGDYDVSLRWTAYTNRATNVPVTITHGGGTFSTTVNQRNDGGMWFPLGRFHFEAGTTGKLVIGTTGADGFVIADAAQWNPVGAPTVAVGVIATSPETTRGGSTPAELVFTRKGSTTVPLTLNYTTSGTALSGEVSPALPGTITFAAGETERKVPLLAPAASLPQGTHTLRLDLAESGDYLVGPSSTATLTIKDRPFDTWRFNHFDSGQLADPAISGATADPDGNGVANLVEFFTGDSLAAPSLLQRDGNFYFRIRRQQEAEDLKIRIWESEDLGTWSPAPELSLPAFLERNGGHSDLVIPIRSGASLPDRGFFQLRVGE